MSLARLVLVVLATRLALVDAGVCNIGGTYFLNGACVPCNPGFYCIGGSDVQTPCPAGTASASASNPGSANPLVLAPCPVCAAGFYSASQQTFCTQCPAGTVGPSIVPVGTFNVAKSAYNGTCNDDLVLSL